MPELPDVEVFRRYFNSTSLHQKITKVEIHSTKILDDVSRRTVQRRLKGQQFEETRRRGKHLFVRMDNDYWLTLHFGMTGFLKYYKEKDEELSHVRMLIYFSNGYHLAYVCQRLLGNASVRKNLDDFIEEKELGADALAIDFQTFNELLDDRRESIKSALMNQNMIAGIGNIFSDEILFQSKIHPKAAVKKLKEPEIKKIYNNIKKVCEAAIDSHVDPEQFPRSFLLTHREKDGKCPRCGTKIETTKVTGRTAYFCPQCQSK